MTFQDQLAADAVNVFASTLVFGESVTYYPEGDLEEDGVDATAVVIRNPVASLPVDGGITELVYLLAIPRSQIEAVTVDSDLVYVDDENGTSRKCLVTKIESSDAGMWRLLVRVGGAAS